jgi:nitroimidazol reductase NimA-like FMN-containing flavoprotein (pyridoxamine 5'-phosphate oxidase superfamily)
MKLIKKLEIQSKENIINFLNTQSVGRFATIDIDGFPQIIPMNFVYVKAEKYRDNSCVLKQDSIYMHSYRFGEKIDNIKRNSNTGFEVDQHLAFLPSYYFHPSDASQADTLYKSVVIKGPSFSLSFIILSSGIVGLWESLRIIIIETILSIFSLSISTKKVLKSSFLKGSGEVKESI